MARVSKPHLLLSAGMAQAYGRPLTRPHPGTVLRSRNEPGRQLASATWPGCAAGSTNEPGRQLASAAWPGCEAGSTNNGSPTLLSALLLPIALLLLAVTLLRLLLRVAPRR